MKKVILLLAFVVLGATANAQDFLGIKPTGSLLGTTNQFKARGFRVVTDSENVKIMEGKYANMNVEVVIGASPITKTVWKISVYFPKQTNWYTIKKEYYDYLDILTSKYGEPKSTYNFFTEPYYEGDGYEMQAVGLEKCTYAAYWFGETNIGLSISEYHQINISYENDANTQLKKSETLTLQSRGL